MKFAFFANTDWYLYNFRLSTARRLLSEGHEVVMISPPGNFGSRFAQHGCRWIPLSTMNRASLNPAREAVTVHQLIRVLREEKPDLLHNFTLKCAVYGAIASRIVRIPATVNAVAGMGYVFTSHTAKARVLRPIVKTLLRLALNNPNSLLILQNPDDADAFETAGLTSPDRIRLIRSSGVNTTRFQPTNRPLGHTERLRVLLAARLLREKGIEEFVEAANLLRQWGRDVEFLLAGTPDEGNPHSIQREQVQKWADEGLIQWLGHVDDMPTLLSTAHVMALPSYYREGVPKSLIEGAASGLALITTDLPGCREVVTQHGEDGLHVEPRNARALAHCIVQLDDDRQLLRKLAHQARSRATTEFDERLVIKKTLDVYAELLDPTEAIYAGFRTTL